MFLVKFFLALALVLGVSRRSLGDYATTLGGGDTSKVPFNLLSGCVTVGPTLAMSQIK